MIKACLVVDLHSRDIVGDRPQPLFRCRQGLVRMGHFSNGLRCEDTVRCVFPDLAILEQYTFAARRESVAHLGCRVRMDGLDHASVFKARTRDEKLLKSSSSRSYRSRMCLQSICRRQMLDEQMCTVVVLWSLWNEAEAFDCDDGGLAALASRLDLE